MVSCVECFKNDGIKTLTECKMCEFHRNGSCVFGSPCDRGSRIQVVSLAEPQKYNRMTFQIASEQIQDESRNYYFLTEIMRPTKNIQDCESYTMLKRKLLSGDLKDKTKSTEQQNVLIKQPMMYLEVAGKESDKVDLIYRNTPYSEVKPFDTHGEWTALYYLYEMYSFSGLSDICIDGRFFKVRLNPIEGYKEQLVVAGMGNRIIVGERG